MTVISARLSRRPGGDGDRTQPHRSAVASPWREERCRDAPPSAKSMAPSVRTPVPSTLGTLRGTRPGNVAGLRPALLPGGFRPFGRPPNGRLRTVSVGHRGLPWLHGD